MTNGKFLLSVLAAGLISGVVSATAVNNAHAYKDEQISLLNDQIDELNYIIEHNGHSHDCCCPECLAIIEQSEKVQELSFEVAYEHTRNHALDCNCKPCETVNAAMGAKF